MMLFLHNWRICLSLPQKFIHIIRDLQFPKTFILKNQNLKLNENCFQEWVQNCDMRYQLNSEHYQNSSLKGKFPMILFNILESEDTYEDLESIISKVRKYSQQLSPLFRLSYLIHSCLIYPPLTTYYVANLSTSHNILGCQLKLVT